MVKFSPWTKLAVWQERKEEMGGEVGGGRGGVNKKTGGSLMRARMALNEGSFPIKGLQRSGNGQILTKWEKCGGVMCHHNNTQGGS